MTADDKDPLTDVDRRSIRILARSTKAAGPNNARIAERLEKAAGSGDRSDYQRAGESFDSLPPNERRRIGTHAERQAETERELVAARKQQPKVKKKPPPPADDALDWKPLVMEHTPAADPTDGQAWKLGRPKPEADAKPAPSVPKPATPKPAGKRGSADVPVPGQASAARSATAPGRQKRPPRSPAADDPEESDGGWDWQRIPEDPVLRSSRKRVAAVDPIEELRRQMLGDDPKRR